MYGEDVETIVQEEDAQLLTEPTVKPVKQRKFQVHYFAVLFFGPFFYGFSEEACIEI